MILRFSSINFKLLLFYFVLLFTYYFPFLPNITQHFGESVCFVVSSLLLLIINIYSNKYSIKSLFVCFLLLFLLFLSLLIDYNRINYRDYFELLRPFYWLISFNIFYNITTFENSNKIIKILFTLLFTLAVWGIIESLINLPPFIHSLHKFNAPVYYNKAITSLIAPYSYGSIMGVGLIYTYIRYRHSNNRYCLYFAATFLLAILFSQSKSAILASITVLFIINLKKFSFFSFICFISTLAVLVYSIIYTELFSYVSNFVFVVYNSYSSEGIQASLNSSDSISNRIDQVQIMFNELTYIPFFGSGIGKNYLYVESFFIVLYRYGIFGILIIASVLLHASMISKYIKNTCKGTSIYYLCLSLPYFFIFLLITSFSANIIDQYRVCFIYIGILGILHAVHQDLKLFYK